MKRCVDRGWVIFILTCLGALPASAAEAPQFADHEYLIRSWVAVDGLPESSATAIAQTPDGYLWLGTFNGLVRFNGVKFTVLNPANTPALPSAGVVNLHLDQAGRLWVSTYRGLVVGRGVSWQDVRKVQGWTGNYVRSFAERRNGDLLIASFDGKLFESSGERLSELPSPPGIQGQGYFVGVDEDDHWWVVQSQFIGRWDGAHWVSTVPAPGGAGDGVGLGPARGGGLWLLLGNELSRWQRGEVVTRIGLTERPGGVWSLSEDSRGHVWISTYDRGFWRVSTDGGMDRWNAGRGVSDAGRCVFEDREGNLWLGTSGDGLIRLKQRRFRHFDLSGERRALVVQSVSADRRGGVWAGTYGHGLFHVTDAGAAHASRAGVSDDAPYVQSVLEDRAGRLWLGTLGRGLRVSETNHTRRLSVAASATANVIALFEDSRGRVWISSGGGESDEVYDGETVRPIGSAQGLPHGATMCFAQDNSGAIWLLRNGAVYRESSEQTFNEIRDANGQTLGGVTFLRGVRDGAMWLGTADRGLLRWKDGRLSHLKREVGLPVEAVQGMVEDDGGFFWITSGHRLVRAKVSDLNAAADGQMARLACQVFDADDGLPTAEFTGGRQPTCVRDTLGRLWFATTKGVAMIDPSGLRLNEKPPPVHVEQVSYFRPVSSMAHETVGRLSRREVESHLPGPFAGRITLPPGSRRIEIHYAGLSFTAPEKVRFQVRIEGLEADWHDTEGLPSAKFHDLPPRDYVFRVRAANGDGVWNETGASLAFTVQPYFWQTWWFRLGVALGLVSLGGGAVWWQSRNRVRRAFEREQAANEIRQLAGRLINAQEDERHRIARELHDDFSQRLALLSVEMELLESAAPAASSSSAPRLGEMATRVKELSSEVHRMAYELHPAKLDHLGLVATARAFCRDLAQKSGVRIGFEATDLPQPAPANVALCLYRVLQESLHNVIRHSGAPEARVTLEAELEAVVLSISDAGRGFEVERARRAGGLGLSSMQERVRLGNGTLTVTSAPGRGTTIRVRVPWKTPDS